MENIQALLKIFWFVSILTCGGPLFCIIVLILNKLGIIEDPED